MFIPNKMIQLILINSFSKIIVLKQSIFLKVDSTKTLTARSSCFLCWWRDIMSDDKWQKAQITGITLVCIGFSIESLALAKF
jgi:hypothetical protein